MFCPECGQVYYTKGNFSNQPQPDWESTSENKSRITNLQNQIASHVKACNLDLAPKLIEDYLEVIAKDKTEKEIMTMKNYAKIGCVMKIKD